MVNNFSCVRDDVADDCKKNGKEKEVNTSEK